MPLTRGPLPGSVYWRRRLVLLTVALVLVVALAKLLGHAGGENAATPAAQTNPLVQVSTTPDAGSDAPVEGPSVDLSTAPTVPVTSSVPSTSPSALATPSGPCQASDVVATPSVAAGTPGKPVTIAVALTTKTTPACTWTVSSKTLQVVVRRLGADVWSTIDCPHAITRTPVVVRQAVPTEVDVVWDTHVSDPTCSAHAPWARLGHYRAAVSALGGQPANVVFALAVPTVTAPPSPTATPTVTAPASPSATPSGRSSAKHGSKKSPTPSPTGTSSPIVDD